MSDITREEAIKILKDTLYDERTPNNYIQAVRMGREALENPDTIHITFRDKNGIIYGGYYDKTRQLIFTAYLTREFAEKIGIQIIEGE